MLHLDHFALILIGMVLQSEEQNNVILHFDAYHNHNGAGINRKHYHSNILRDNV